MKSAIIGKEMRGLMKNSHIWKNLCITAVILFLCTLVSSIFDDIEIRTENIMLIYLIGVLLIVVETRSFLWGITSSLLSILQLYYHDYRVSDCFLCDRLSGQQAAAACP